MGLDFTGAHAEVAAQETVVDSVIAYLQGLAAAGQADQAAVDQIVADLKANREQLEAAIPANVPPAPPA